MKLKQYGLSIKLGLQFLNAFSFSLKDKVMLFIRQGDKITNTIISFNTIKMVNYPSIWKWFTIRLFPNPNVFKDITAFLCSWIIWLPQFYISMRAYCFTTFEVCSTLTFAATEPASWRMWGTKPTTINARLPMIHIPPTGCYLWPTFPQWRILATNNFTMALPTKFAFIVHWLSARWTWFMTLWYLIRRHHSIIQNVSTYVKVEKMMKQKPGYSVDSQEREG